MDNNDTVTLSDAVDYSRSHNEIVTVEAADPRLTLGSIIDLYSGEDTDHCADGMGGYEIWAVGDSPDGMSWRLHIVQAEDV